VDVAIKTALKSLEKLGARMVEVDFPSAPLQQSIINRIIASEAYSFHEMYLQEQGESYGNQVRNRIEAGRSITAVDYVRAQRERLMMKREFMEAFEKVDVVVTPTLPITAPLIDHVELPWGNDSETANAALTRFTRHFNIAGLPAISIPCGFTAEDLPIGMQIAGKPFAEATVLRVAHAYEQDTMWYKRRPSASSAV